MRLRSTVRGKRSGLRAEDGVQLPRNYTDTIIFDSVLSVNDDDTVDTDDTDDDDYDYDYDTDTNVNQDDVVVYDINNLDSDLDSNIEFDISSLDNDNNDSFNDSAIPELDINELIILANQLVRNSTSRNTNTSNNVANVHIRFPLIRSITEARDIIMQYERLQNSRDINNNNNNNNNQDNVIWNSITQDYSGISISGTRLQDSLDSVDSNIDRNNSTESTENTEHIHRQPVWLELAGLITVTMFMFAVYRLVTNLISISAFSDNVVGDVVDFVDYVNTKAYYKDIDHSLKNSTLVKKFAFIIKDEMPYLPDTIWLVLTVTAFSAYTVLTSGIVLTSMLFATMCLTMCIVLRWRHIGDFVVRVVGNGEHCI